MQEGFLPTGHHIPPPWLSLQPNIVSTVRGEVHTATNDRDWQILLGLYCSIR